MESGHQWIAVLLAMKDEGQRPFMNFLERVRADIDGRMDEHVLMISGDDATLSAHFRGGKRLRAGTALLVHEALSNGNEGRDMVLDLAAAVEIAHGISLMMDDVLDGDTVRRGAATVNAVKGAQLTLLESVRMLVIPYSLAAPYGEAVVGHLARAHEEMVRGAILELEPAGQREGMTVYDRLISMKSGSLFGLAARYGALAAGCCDERASLAGAYGRDMGMVHQFSDDIADLRGALSAGRAVRGSEARLFSCMMPDGDERRRAVDRGTLPEDVETELGKELRLRVRRAERAARKMASSVGRCGGRKPMKAHLPVMLSAPCEIARLMLSI